MTAAEVLAGPRGRRVCVEVALSADESLRPVLFWAERAFDPDDGSVVTFSAHDGSPVDPPDPPSPAEVAAAVNAVTDAGIRGVLDDDGEVLACLSRSVDAARYWQAPDSRDLLAARPEVRSALARIADHLAASGLLARWSAGFEGRGFLVRFEGEGSGLRGAGGAEAVLAAWSEAAVREEARARADAARPGAPTSGTWWSSPMQLVTTTDAFAGVPCGLALVEDELGWERATVWPTHGAGRVLELDEVAWRELCIRYPMEVSASRRGDWGRTTGRAGAWVLPDWRAVAEDWDAVHLSIAQYLALAGRALPVDAERATLVAGWSPGATVWLRDRVGITGQPQGWRRPDAGASGAPWLHSGPSQF